jgi:hypothetical protein
MDALARELENLSPYTPETIEAAVRGLATKLGVKAGVLIHAARVAVTGSAVSPDLFVGAVFGWEAEDGRTAATRARHHSE